MKTATCFFQKQRPIQRQRITCPTTILLGKNNNDLTEAEKRLKKGGKPRGKIAVVVTQKNTHRLNQ